MMLGGDGHATLIWCNTKVTIKPLSQVDGDICLG
jgi:hypothetical protein